MKRGLWRHVLALLLLAACTLGSSNPGETPGDAAQGELTVAAAADLQFAFREIAELFEAQTGRKVTLVFGSTGQLAQQIENGAPYDLLAAADVAYIERLVEKKLVVEESVALYARGRIVLAWNRQAGVSPVELEDLLDPGIRQVAIANPEHAPYGMAAKQALEAAGIWEALQPKLVLGENVRQALQYVQTGDAEAGIVALSVADVAEIQWMLIDEGLHEPLDQALGIVAGSAQQEAARQFAAFINSEQGRAILRGYGFTLPGETPDTNTGARP